jgi:taurine dioxygenase
MPISVHRADAPLGAEIRGADLARPVTDEDFAAIEAAFVKNGVVVFRDQTFTEEQHIAFSRRFGDLEIHVLKQYLHPRYPEILMISNVEKNGRRIGVADAGRYWHTDLSYVREPSRCSLLYAREVPVAADGRVLGDTLFASTAEAYDALPEAMKKRIAGLRAVHRYGDRYDRMQTSGGVRDTLSEEQRRQTPDVVHPVVRTHAISGRKCLYVNEGFTVSLLGLPEDEARDLLTELCAHAHKPEFVYRHKWRKGDLLMWDNCQTQHLAVGDYALPQRRLMHRTTVKGAMPF